MSFIDWFVLNFPQILLKPPFSAFTGIMLLFFLCSLFARIKHM